MTCPQICVWMLFCILANSNDIISVKTGMRKAASCFPTQYFIIEPIMEDETYCKCLLKSFGDRPVPLYSTILQGVFSLVICVCGVFLNYKVSKKLKQERKRRHLGKKGNVVEPIMRWFVILQIIFWPLQLLFFWVHVNSIIAVKTVPWWLCRFMTSILATGRIIIAFNSFFVALIRYMYIVHELKANQWNFETIGRLSQIGSIMFPTLVSFFMNTTFDFNLGLWTQCGNSKRILLNFTQNYFSSSIVHIVGMISFFILMIVFLNITEAFLYFKIFRVIKR